MVKSKNYQEVTKRMMTMFSFYTFKSKLMWKCKLHNKKLFIVDESYTSKTCTNCGVINDIKGRETLKCNDCNFSIDRDVAGARNIFIKNVILN